MSTSNTQISPESKNITSVDNLTVNFKDTSISENSTTIINNDNKQTPKKYF